MAQGPYMDFPTKIGKLMMDNGYETLDAIAVVNALHYAAYHRDGIIKAKVGAESMWRWQMWKLYCEELEGGDEGCRRRW